MGRLVMAAASQTELDEEVATALASLGASPNDPAYDALVAPREVATALGHLSPQSAFLLRVSPPLGGATETYGPKPEAPYWLRGSVGSSSVKLGPLRRAAGSPQGEKAARVQKILVESAEGRCCDAPSCSARRTQVSAWLLFSEAPAEGVPARLLVAEAADLDAAGAAARIRRVARQLATCLVAPLEGAENEEDDTTASPSEAAATSLDAAKLARFGMRLEGDRFVLRDHTSLGPAGSARSKGLVGLLMLALAIALWVEVSRAFSRGDRNVTVGLSAIAALVTIAGYALLAIARFGSRYHARSAPLFWAGHDRFVVAPWVSREGAVDSMPEGRIGAAIAIEEVRAVSTKHRDGLFVVEIDSDHGPFDVLTLEDASLAAFWRAAIERVLADVAHPKSRASARKRARERAA